MAIFSATLGSFGAISFLSSSQSQQHDPSSSSIVNPFNFPKCPHKLPPPCQWHPHYRHHNPKIMVSSSSSSNNTHIDEFDSGLLQRPSAPDSYDALRQARRSSDWKAANAYRDSGLIYNGRVEGFNAGGLLVRFYSIMGFLPYPPLSPVHSCQEPDQTIKERARELIGAILSVKVIIVDEEKRKLVLSEKEASWFKHSKHINIGGLFEGRVGSVEDYGAFVHLRFPDGLYHLTGLIHISEVSWDLVQDVRDFLREGEEVRVKVISIDTVKMRLTLSIKQLEEDPLLETLDKVIRQDGSGVPNSISSTTSSPIDPLPGLDTILEELLQEDGINEARISRQGFEKRVVSQDLQLWLSNAPPMDQRFTLLARAGRQVQEIHLKTSLDQEGIKKAIQRVLERVP
uniref:S1 motif domain-containing protein n=1 Tax=Medicago truncatula TaxID=3880 RepID=I3SR84_MEDTR|nr:unknown [Medicago truncatula]